MSFGDGVLYGGLLRVSADIRDGAGTFLAIMHCITKIP